jgi:hypothetical protein
LRREAVVETSLPLAGESANASAASLAGESCRLVVDQPQRLEIEAELTVPGLVVLSDLFAPGWTAEVLGSDSAGSASLPGEAGRDRDSAGVLRTNRIMRGVWLRAGRHRIIYTYRPTPFYVGATLSLLGWLGAAVCGVRCWRATKEK